MSAGKAGLMERLLGLLFPNRCFLCGKLIPAGEVCCETCRKQLPPKPFQRKLALPGAGAAGVSVLSPLSYEGRVRKALFRFKFRGKKGLAKPMGALMAGAASRTGGKFTAVTWVAMTAKKRRKRGYDQSELLARAVAEELGLPCLPLLQKVRENQVQHQLSGRERRKNVKGAYLALPEAAGQALLLVDDIVTTGATLGECAKELYRAGAAEVTGLCAADAPETKLEKEGTP